MARNRVVVYGDHPMVEVAEIIEPKMDKVIGDLESWEGEDLRKPDIVFTTRKCWVGSGNPRALWMKDKAGSLEAMDVGERPDKDKWEMKDMTRPGLAGREGRLGL